jgi:hypothetical protein
MMTSQGPKPEAASQSPPTKVPTLTTEAAIPKEPEQTPYTVAPELDDSIVAAPLVMPDFINVPPANPNIAFRWINHKAGDGLRFSQAQAQGWVVANEKDVKANHLTPYRRDGGTKFVNGDLILMKIERKKYLGALKYKHQVAAALADDSILRTLSAKRAASDLAAAGANRNYFRGKISTFTPEAADLSHTPLADAGMELGRLGHVGAPDIGTGGSINTSGDK